jgi:protein-L-isoaspartate(D-aspartate) O-methyltransferase
LTIGGILVIPVGGESSQKMLRIIRTGEKEFTQEEFADFKFVPLLGKSGWDKSSF